MGKRILFALCVLAAGAASAWAFDDDELNKVTFQNTTGVAIEYLFLSPGDSDHWGPDLIGADDVMDDGASLAFYVHYPEKTFKFDILAIDEKGNAFEVYDFLLTDGKDATIKLTRKNLSKDAPDFRYCRVNITNETGYEVDYLFFSPDDSDAWGADLLDEETTLSDGDTHSFVVPVVDDAIDFWLMAVDEDMDEYQFSVTLDPADFDDDEDMEYDWSVTEEDLQ